MCYLLIPYGPADGNREASDSFAEKSGVVKMSDTKQKYVAYVGTFTLGDSIGIHIYDVDVEEGTLQERKVIPVNNSSFICRSKNGKFLYSIADEGVAVFDIKPDGDLEMINQIGIDGMRGCYICTDRTGKYLLVGGYHDGKVTLVHTHHNGRLGSIMDGVFHKGTGSIAERNFWPRVTCIVPTPDDHFFCAVDNGIDQIRIYRITDQNKLDLVDIVRGKRGSGPRLLKFRPDGRFAYVINEVGNTVDVYSYKEENGMPVFERVQTVQTSHDEMNSMYDASSGLCISADGRYLFASTAGENIVSMYAVDPESGQLTREFALPVSGEYPKDIALFPDGKHLASVNYDSGSITTFAVNYEKKLLVMKGRPMRLDTPNCILFTKIETGVS